MYQVEILFKSGVTKKFRCLDFELTQNYLGQWMYEWYTDDFHVIYFDPDDITFVQSVLMDDAGRPPEKLFTLD